MQAFGKCSRNRRSQRRPSEALNGVNLISTPAPNQSGGTYPASKLLDGLLPTDGWRSTWTAWLK